MGASLSPRPDPALSPVLDETESRQLLAAVQNGDLEARDRLIKGNLRLVYAMTRRFQASGYDPDDLFQVGCIGLMKAIDNFDPGFGVRLSTYAVPLILGEIKRFIRDDGPITVSRSLKEMAVRIARLKESFLQSYGREPSVSEIAALLEVDKDRIVIAMEAMQPPVSLNATVFPSEGDPVYLLDRVSSEAEYPLAGLDKLSLRQVLSQLSSRQREVIILRFFQEKKQAEIAKTLGVSQVQVSRIEKQALQQLRRLIGEPF